MTKSPEVSGRVTRRYGLAVGIIALLTIATQVFLQSYLSNVRYDSRAVNLAGKMRMLSQRMVKQATLISIRDRHHTDAIELRATVDELSLIFQALQSGSAELGLLPVEEKNLSLFVMAEPLLAQSLSAVETLLDAEQSSVTARQALGTLIVNDEALLAAIANIPSKLDLDATRKIDFLRYVELVLLALTLFTLVLEVLFIFRPMVKIVDSAVLAAQVAGARQLAITGKAQVGMFASRLSRQVLKPAASIRDLVSEMSDKLANSVEVSSEEVRLSLEQVNADAELVQRTAKLLSGLSIGQDDKQRDVISANELYNEAMAVVGDDVDGRALASVRLVPLDRELRVTCVPHKIIHALVDLIENALEATEDQVKPWVEVMFLEQTDSVDILVTDSGGAIDDDVRSKMFTPFFSTKLRTSQLGLGLPIAQRFAEDHGGTLIYRPRNGRTCFVLSIPNLQKLVV